MKISYTGFSESGLREQNEDCIYPAPHNTPDNNTTLFLVCDGVGGAVKGEMASRLACMSIVKYFEEQVQRKASREKEINAAVKQAEVNLNDYIRENTGSNGMATTLALVHLHVEGATIAHIGDSRVYHIREGSIIFQTHDHTLVNEFISSGYITEEEAAQHPKRNVITRAITGNDEQVTAEIHFAKDIQAGDYFLLCSDGVLESIDEQFILSNFDPEAIPDGNTPEIIINRIKKKCAQQSKDNYSAILVQLSNF